MASYVLQHLFEFCIPCIQDYGCAAKNNSWEVFLECYQRLLNCKGSGYSVICLCSLGVCVLVANGFYLFLAYNPGPSMSFFGRGLWPTDFIYAFISPVPNVI